MYMGVGFRLAFGEGALELKVYARVLGTAFVNWPQNERALLPDDTSVRLMRLWIRTSRTLAECLQGRCTVFWAAKIEQTC